MPFHCPFPPQGHRPWLAAALPKYAKTSIHGLLAHSRLSFPYVGLKMSGIGMRQNRTEGLKTRTTHPSRWTKPLVRRTFQGGGRTPRIGHLRLKVFVRLGKSQNTPPVPTSCPSLPPQNHGEEGDFLPAVASPRWLGQANRLNSIVPIYIKANGGSKGLAAHHGRPRHAAFPSCGWGKGGEPEGSSQCLAVEGAAAQLPARTITLTRSAVISGDFALAASKASKPWQLQGFSGAGARKTMAVGHSRRGLEIDVDGLHPCPLIFAWTDKKEAGPQARLLVEAPEVQAARVGCRPSAEPCRRATRRWGHGVTRRVFRHAVEGTARTLPPRR